MVTDNSNTDLQNFILKIMNQFEARIVKILDTFLGIVTEKSDRSMNLRNEVLVKSLLKILNVSNCKSSLAPMAPGMHLALDNTETLSDPKLHQQLIGWLLYTSNIIKAQISNAVG